METYYFGNTGNITRYLIIYDIIDNRKRVQIAKLFESYGKRVQLSAFEFSLNNMKYKKMISHLNEIVNEDDNIRIYKLDNASQIYSEKDDSFSWDYNVLVC